MRIELNPEPAGRAHQFWHTWFAWHPIVVRTDAGERMLVWLETVERREGTSSTGEEFWEYRNLRNPPYPPPCEKYHLSAAMGGRACPFCGEDSWVPRHGVSEAEK